MSSLMMKAAMVLFASLLSGGKPSAAKKRADAARSLTGRLTAILVDIGASVVVAGGCCLLTNAVREVRATLPARCASGLRRIGALRVGGARLRAGVRPARGYRGRSSVAAKA